MGVPLYRMDTWQKIMSVPVSDSEMWDWTEEIALTVHPVLIKLRELAADAEIIHNDDTKMKVLELMEENKLN